MTWEKFDPARPPTGHVWVWDNYYLGATVGYWNGHSMCTVQYGDDAGISHWMELVVPAHPPLEELAEWANRE